MVMGVCGPACLPSSDKGRRTPHPDARDTQHRSQRLPDRHAVGQPAESLARPTRSRNLHPDLNRRESGSMFARRLEQVLGQKNRGGNVRGGVGVGRTGSALAGVMLQGDRLDHSSARVGPGLGRDRPHQGHQLLLAGQIRIHRLARARVVERSIDLVRCEPPEPGKGQPVGTQLQSAHPGLVS